MDNPKLKMRSLYKNRKREYPAKRIFTLCSIANLISRTESGNQLLFHRNTIQTAAVAVYLLSKSTFECAEFSTRPQVGNRAFTVDAQ